MHPILFHIGDWPVHSFGVMLSLGILTGLLVACYVARRQDRYLEEIVDLSFFAVVGGIIGARLWEVAFTWEYYSDNLGQALAIWNGGLSVQGAVLGGLLAVIWYCRRNKVPFWPVADTLAPGLLMGQAVGRLGCFFNGCCFGIPHHFGVVYQPGTDAHYTFGSQTLFPAVLFEAGWDVIALLLLLKVFNKKPFDGFIALSYFILYSIGRFTIEFWRGDSLRTIMELKVAQLTSVTTILVAVAIMLYLAYGDRCTNQEPGNVKVKK